jgi:hypothetical protein
LTGGKIFLSLQDLCALQMAKFRGPPIHACGNDRQCRLEFRVPVALHDLRAERGRLKAKVLADHLFNARVEVCVGPYSAAQFSHADAPLYAIEPFDRASKFIEHQGQLQTESYRFRVDAVAAPDHWSKLELDGSSRDYPTQFAQVPKQEI